MGCSVMQIKGNSKSASYFLCQPDQYVNFATILTFHQS